VLLASGQSEDISILPIGAKHQKAATKLQRELKEKNIRAWLQDENETVSKKIREAELQKIPYVAVIGDKEIKAKSVRLRTREKGDVGMVKITMLEKRLLKEIAERSL